MYKQLFVFIEGPDDSRFFEKIIKPTCKNKYNPVLKWEYAQESSERIKNFLNSINSMNSAYFFLRDINNSPCVTAKIDGIKENKEYGATISLDSIIVVVKEVESWYLAGLDDKSCRELEIKSIRKTDDVTKEQFKNLMPKKFDSRIDFMQEILKRFSIETAKQKNKSFRYFITKIEAL